MEEFRTIEGYSNYQVSNLGNVKSLKFGKERILKNSLSGRYLVIMLLDNGNRKTFMVHQLVAMAFLNHTNCGHEVVVDHIDNDPINNNVDNLQLISQRKNSSKDRVGGASEYIGVGWHKKNKKWRASITIHNKTKHLGYFTNELEAAQAYQTALTNLK